MQFTALEPRCYAGFLVGMATERRVATRRQNSESQLVFARAKQLDVVAVVRPVIGDHGMEIAFELGVVALFFQLERYVEIRHETAFLEALPVIRRGADVSFQVHVGIGGRAHHAGGRHFDRLQIHRADFKPRAQLRFADRILLGLGQRSEKEQGERQGKSARMMTSWLAI